MNQLTIVIVEKIPVEKEPGFPQILRYLRRKLLSRRDNIAVSMLLYFLRRRSVLAGRMIRRTRKMIMIRMRWKI